MEPHHIDHDGHSFAIAFERTPEGWVCRIRREDDGVVQVLAFPDGPGFDPEDVRGSLIAGCEAAIARMRWDRRRGTESEPGWRPAVRDQQAS